MNFGFPRGVHPHPHPQTQTQTQTQTHRHTGPHTLLLSRDSSKFKPESINRISSFVPDALPPSPYIPYLLLHLAAFLSLDQQKHLLVISIVHFSPLGLSENIFTVLKPLPANVSRFDYVNYLSWNCPLPFFPTTTTSEKFGGISWESSCLSAGLGTVRNFYGSSKRMYLHLHLLNDFSRNSLTKKRRKERPEQEIGHISPTSYTEPEPAT